MNQWVRVKREYINLAQASVVELTFGGEEDSRNDVVKVAVYAGDGLLWEGQSTEPKAYSFDPDGMMNVLTAMPHEHLSIWVAPGD